MTAGGLGETGDDVGVTDSDVIEPTGATGCGPLTAGNVLER